MSSLASEGEQWELVPTPCDLLGMYIIITITNNIKSVNNTVGDARASFCFAGGGSKADGTNDDSKYDSKTKRQMQTGGKSKDSPSTSKDSRSKVVNQMGEAARKKLQDMMSGLGTEEQGEDSEEDPFVCDITGALISMVKDGRYHFDDGRGPDDPSAVCMSVTAYKVFDTLSKEHPETWEVEYGDKTLWRFIPAGSDC